jgi:hypothetical protein
MRSSLLALVIAVAAALTGCGAAPPPARPAPSTFTPADDARVNEAYRQCMLDHGIAVTKAEDGSIRFDDPDSSMRTEYAAAHRECSQRLIDEGLLAGATPESLRREYQVLTAIHACLAEHGFPVAEWISEEVYIDRNGEVNMLQSETPIILADAQAACPAEYAELAKL